MECLGQRLGYTCDNRRLHNVSLGQGQEKVAEEALKIAAKEGHWVILQVRGCSVPFVAFPATVELTSLPEASVKYLLERELPSKTERPHFLSQFLTVEINRCT